jgi:hypothetical protein
MKTREEQIAGARDLIAWLEAHPEVPMPYQLSNGYVLIMTHTVEDPKATLAAIARALPGKVDKDTYANQFEISGRVGGIEVKATAVRNDVCERVVTGTREVTKTVPDPAVVVPMVEVTETVEDVEWVCGPLLGEAKSDVDVQSAYSERLRELEPDGIPVRGDQVDLVGALRDAVDRAKAARS